MKKEDFTTRLLKLFFHIQGPLDECRQEIIYRACARALIQIVYSSLLLFLFYLLFGRFISIQLGLFLLLIFHKLFVQRLPLDTFWENLSQTERLLPLLVCSLETGAIFGTMTYAFLSEHGVKHSESVTYKENIEK